MIHYEEHHMNRLHHFLSSLKIKNRHICYCVHGVGIRRLIVVIQINKTIINK